MNQICGIHNCEMIWKTGTAKQTGKPYAFWSCSQRMPDGGFCTFKAPKPQGNNATFNQQLNQSASQMDQSKKDEIITRTAIAKSLIESGKTWENAKEEAQEWVKWCITGKMPVSIQVDTPIQDEEIPFLM